MPTTSLLTRYSTACPCAQFSEANQKATSTTNKFSHFRQKVPSHAAAAAKDATAIFTARAAEKNNKHLVGCIAHAAYQHSLN
jgi:hypothetical protein